MDDKSLIDQFAALLHENNAAIFEYVRAETDKLRAELMGEMRDEIRKEGQNTRNEITAYIENTTNKRIDTLFDGYVSVRERHDLLQKELDEVRDRVSQLELIVKSLAS